MFNKDDDIIKPPITFPEPSTPAAEPAQSTEAAPAEAAPSGPGRMQIEDVFTIRGRGKVAVGEIESGSFKVGQNVTIKTAETEFTSTIKGIEVFMKHLDEAKAGDKVGLLLEIPDDQKIGADDLILG